MIPKALLAVTSKALQHITQLSVRHFCESHFADLTGFCASNVMNPQFSSRLVPDFSLVMDKESVGSVPIAVPSGF